VVRIDENEDGTLRFVTRGDNAHFEDQPFSGDEITGRLVAVIPRMGSAQQWIADNLLLASVGMSVFFLLFWGSAAMLAMNLLVRPCKNPEDMIE